MRSFILFAHKNRFNSILTTALFLMLSFILPPLGHVSGAIAGFFTLRNGLIEGGIVILGAAALIFLSGLAAGIQIENINHFILLVFFGWWLPVIILAYALRYTRSLGLTLELAAGLSVIFLLSMFFSIDDINLWSKEILEQTLQPVIQSQASMLSSVDAGLLIERLAKILPGLISVTLLFSVVINLFIARWMQAVIYNPGGFQSEFHQLRTNKLLAYFTVGLVALYYFSENLSYLIICLLLVTGCIYFFQGLSIIYAFLEIKQVSRAWLFGLYIVLFFMPQITLLVSLLGYVDSWLDVRRRFLNSPPA